MVCRPGHESDPGQGEPAGSQRPHQTEAGDRIIVSDTVFFIRTASERDLQEIQDLLAETWHDTYDPVYGEAEVDRITSEWHSRENLLQRLARPDSEFVLADTGDDIAGMAFASCPDGGRVVTLYQIYVRPRFQNKGAGSALIDEVCDCFPKAGSIQLEVEEANSKAIEFYRRRGFVRTGKAASLSADGGQTLQFEKSL